MTGMRILSCDLWYGDKDTAFATDDEEDDHTGK